MTLLSLIAIIASFAVGFGIAINTGCYWERETKDTPIWKSTLWKSLRWFVLNEDETPQWRRTLLKILFSALMLTALGCGFWDTYSSFATENRGVIDTIGSILLSIASFALLITICFAPKDLKDWILLNYFGISTPKWITVTNYVIFGVWIAVFIGGLYMENSGRVFALISVSAVIAAIICIILYFLGAACYAIGKIIFILIIRPLLCWIKWLQK